MHLQCIIQYTKNSNSKNTAYVKGEKHEIIIGKKKV